VVVAPDPGSVKRAQRFSQRLGVPVAFVDKRRVSPDPESGEEVVATAVVGKVDGCQAIIFDEEVDRGSSLVTATDLLYDSGATEVYAACTHPVLSGPATDRLSKARIKELVVTDTVPVPPEKRWDSLVILSIAPLLAETIRRINKGQSISVLFE
jgi:ribose-phosphate pyrophosphokinase